jgi:hypothetical protein
MFDFNQTFYRVGQYFQLACALPIVNVAITLRTDLRRSGIDPVTSKLHRQFNRHLAYCAENAAGNRQLSRSCGTLPAGLPPV